MMHLIELFRIRLSAVAPCDLWAEFNTHNRELAIGILLKMANRLVLIRIEYELLLASNR